MSQIPGSLQPWIDSYLITGFLAKTLWLDVDPTNPSQGTKVNGNLTVTDTVKTNNIATYNDPNLKVNANCNFVVNPPISAGNAVNTINNVEIRNRNLAICDANGNGPVGYPGITTDPRWGYSPVMIRGDTDMKGILRINRSQNYTSVFNKYGVTLQMTNPGAATTHDTTIQLGKDFLAPGNAAILAYKWIADSSPLNTFRIDTNANQESTTPSFVITMPPPPGLGNVGIHVDQPQYPLDIKGDTAIRNITTGNVIMYVDAANGDFTLNAADNTKMMFIDGNGTNILMGKGAGVIQTSNCLAIGNLSGVNQSAQCVAIGNSAGGTSQGTRSVAIGAACGTTQADNCLAIGYNSGISQASSSISIGTSAGLAQNTNSVAIGVNSGQNQNTGCVAIGNNAMQTSTGTNSVAIGVNCGQTGQGGSSVAVGSSSGVTNQGIQCVAIGASAAATTQGEKSVSVGFQAGNSTQGNEAVAIGAFCATSGQGFGGIAIGSTTGQTSQGNSAIAIGYAAGQSSQTQFSIAIGRGSGNTGQAQDCVAIGRNAGAGTQGLEAVAIGKSAQVSGAGASAVAIGNQAGNTSQGAAAVAIGALAGYTSQHANSIVINSSGSVLNTTAASQFLVSSVRTNVLPSSATNNQAVFYDPTSKEFFYQQFRVQKPNMLLSVSNFNFATTAAWAQVVYTTVKFGDSGTTGTGPTGFTNTGIPITQDANGYFTNNSAYAMTLKVSANIDWSNTGTTGVRYIAFRIYNATNVAQTDLALQTAGASSFASGQICIQTSTQFQLASGFKFSVIGYHTQGSAITGNSEVSITPL